MSRIPYLSLAPRLFTTVYGHLTSKRRACLARIGQNGSEMAMALRHYYIILAYTCSGVLMKGEKCQKRMNCPLHPGISTSVHFDDVCLKHLSRQKDWMKAAPSLSSPESWLHPLLSINTSHGNETSNSNEWQSCHVLSFGGSSTHVQLVCQTVPGISWKQGLTFALP